MPEARTATGDPGDPSTRPPGGEEASLGGARLATEMVDGVLTRYIVIHNRMLKLSLWGFLPLPRAFRPIDFCKHEVDLGGLESELRGVGMIIELASGDQGAESSTKKFLDSLNSYSEALREAISTLGTLARNLCLKSRGEKRYLWRDYKQDTNHYRATVGRYVGLGGHLNELHTQMQIGAELQTETGVPER